MNKDRNVLNEKGKDKLKKYKYEEVDEEMINHIGQNARIALGIINKNKKKEEYDGEKYDGEER